MSKAKAHSPTACTEGVCDRTDGWLLERFAVQRDETAFAALVQRYGPLVLGTCRRVLQHEQDAEEAFQATFLVLARKARQLCQAKTVGPWLYNVADRIAKKARGSKVRQQMRETELRDIMVPERTPEWVWRDLQRVIHEEIDRLPLIYRELIVFCYLQGKTNERAAEQLGCPQGTVLSRLARARDRLRIRLSRRGVGLSTGLLATLWTEQAASATVPSALSDATIRAAVPFVCGPSSMTGTISAPVVSLAEAFLKSSTQNRSKIVAIAWMALGSALATILLLLLGLSALRPHPELAEAGPAVQRSNANVAGSDRFEGTWRVLRAEFDRQPLAFANLPVYITGDRWTLMEQPVANRFTLYTLDAMKGPTAKARRVVIGVEPVFSYTNDTTKDPKTIDLTFPGRRRALGIYALEGDRLELCYRLAGSERPTEYATSPAGQTYLFHFQRVPSADEVGTIRKSDQGDQEERSAIVGESSLPHSSKDLGRRGQQP